MDKPTKELQAHEHLLAACTGLLLALVVFLVYVIYGMYDARATSKLGVYYGGVEVGMCYETYQIKGQMPIGCHKYRAEVQRLERALGEVPR